MGHGKGVEIRVCMVWFGFVYVCTVCAVLHSCVVVL